MKPSRHPRYRPLVGFAALLFALIQSSCGTIPTKPEVKEGSAKVAAISEKASNAGTEAKESGQPSSMWYVASSDPITYFPVGLPSDPPTSHRDGEWVVGGTDGTRFFIPFEGAGGLSREELEADAFARRSPELRRADRTRDVVDGGVDFVAWTAWTGIRFICAMGGG